LTVFAGAGIMRVKKEFAGNRTRFLYSPWLLALLVSRVFFVDGKEKGRLRHVGKVAFSFSR
jgi:hypothetical protein